MGRARGAVLHTLDAFRGGKPTRAAALRRWQWLSPGESAALQAVRLAELLKHAAASVPYYAEPLRRIGGRVTGSSVSAALADVPLLDKAMLRENFDRLVSTDIHRRKWFVNTSGGSTGEPTRHAQDRVFHEWTMAGKQLFDEWSGYRVGDRQVILWGSQRDLFVGRETVRTKVARWVRNERWLNAFRMSLDDMRRYAGVMTASQPRRILAYADSLYELVRAARQHGWDLPQPRSVMTSAGTLHPFMRREIEAGLCAPVFDRYGSREVGDIACQCEQGAGLHVVSPLNVVEVLREDGTPAAPGELGEVVITSLTNYALPLIRYRIGDLAAWAPEPCTCGRGWPCLVRVDGRVTDVFRRADGGIVSAATLVHTVGVALHSEHVLRYQLVQETLHHVHILVVPGPAGPNAAHMARLEAAVRRVMGGACTVTAGVVDDIAPAASGKYRYTVSRVGDASLPPRESA